MRHTAGMQALIPDDVLDLFDHVEAQRVGCGHDQVLNVPALPGLSEVASSVLRSHAGFTDNPEALFTAFDLTAPTLAALITRHGELFRGSGFGQPPPQALLEAVTAVPDLLVDVDVYVCADGAWALDVAAAHVHRMVTDAEFEDLNRLLDTCALQVFWPTTWLQSWSEATQHPRPAVNEYLVTAFMWTGADAGCTECPGHWQLGPGAHDHFSPYV